MLRVCEFLDSFQDEAEPRKTRHGAREKYDEVSFTDSGVIRALLYECLIARVSLEFGAMPSFGQGIMFDI
jgi:hypothetical protein